MPHPKSAGSGGGTAAAEALSAAAAARLTSVSRIVDAPAGGQILFEGENATELYCVLVGVVSVFKLMPDGRRQIIGFLYPGDFLGVTFNLESTYGYGAEAVTHVSLRAYPRREFERLLNESPAVRRAFIAKMADELTQAQDRMLLLGRRSAVERVGVFLLTLARRQRDGPPFHDLSIPMRWADIADYLGLSAETVSRTLAGLRAQGVISTGRSGDIRILDAAALEALAESPDRRR